MSYILQRQDRFYVVAYDGLDPLTGRERRRWHPVGHDRDEAEQLAARLDRERDATPAAPTGLRVPEMGLCWSEGCAKVASSVVFRSVPFVVRFVLARVGLLLASGDRRDAEILALRHQLVVLQRQVPRPTFDDIAEPSWACCPRCSIVTVSLRCS